MSEEKPAAGRPSALTSPEPSPPDRLNAVGVLTRREIEARILLPMLRAFAQEIGEARVLEIARGVIVELARQQGQELARQSGGCDLERFASALEDWKRDDAYEVDVLEQSDERLAFNVTRCRYAEMYKRLGVPGLGRLLSCNRDFALIRGFNPEVTLTRTQTIMEGATHCDFRFEHRASPRADLERPPDDHD